MTASLNRIGTNPIAAPLMEGARGSLQCKAFRADAALQKVMAGTAPALEAGLKDSKAFKTVQTALFSLDYLEDRTGVDGDFGPNSQAALESFQRDYGLQVTGKLDQPTLSKLDVESARQIGELKRATLADRNKPPYKIVADISDLNKTRLYVLNGDGSVAAKYLTSPGTQNHPTPAKNYSVQQIISRGTWNPPNSPWASGLGPVGPGIDNPMGILKMRLGGAILIHGIPAGKEAMLGKGDSHGCLRVSGSNILDLREKYARVGTNVTVTRNAAEGARLAAKAERVPQKATDEGRQYLFGYASGELG